MTAQSLVQGYTLSGIQSMLGISRSAILALIKAGFVAPERGPRNAYRFGFQDVVLLRMAYGLHVGGFPPRKILRALRLLKTRLPVEMPADGFRITAVGNDIVVRGRTAQWEAESGQLVMDLDVAPSGDAINVVQLAPATEAMPNGAASEWFEKAQLLEESDRHAAETAYRRALMMAAGYTDAHLNLGALLCELGRCDEAVRMYDDALANNPNEPLLHFNRAIALEDQGRLDDALDAYEQCIRLTPDFADAHYNAGLIHDRLGQHHLAIRRLGEYRRLSKR